MGKHINSHRRSGIYLGILSSKSKGLVPILNLKVKLWSSAFSPAGLFPAEMLVRAGNHQHSAHYPPSAAQKMPCHPQGPASSSLSPQSWRGAEASNQRIQKRKMLLFPLAKGTLPKVNASGRRQEEGLPRSFRNS